jgi:two-component system chemotaxis response regulator CheB
VPAAALVVLAASAGGFSVLEAIFSALPADVPAAVALVQHRAAAQTHMLATRLARVTALHVVDARAGDVLTAGTVYIAPPGRDVTVTPARMLALTAGPNVRRDRSAADSLLISAASVFGGRLAAVVLAGRDGDLADGVRAVHAAGGVVITEDPAGAHVPSKSAPAADPRGVEQVLVADAVADALVRWLAELDSVG